MGLENKLVTKIFKNEIIQMEVNKLWKNDIKKYMEFEKKITEDILDLLKNYSKENLESFFVTDIVYKKIIKKLSKVKQDDFFNELNLFCINELEFENHLNTSGELIFILVGAEFEHNGEFKKENSLYINGLIFPKNVDGTSSAERIWSAAMVTKKRIYNDEKVIDYLKLHNNFPKWLSELNLDNIEEMKSKSNKI